MRRAKALGVSSFLSVARLRFLLLRRSVVAEVEVKMPLEADDLGVDRGAARMVGGRSMLEGVVSLLVG